MAGETRPEWLQRVLEHVRAAHELVDAHDAEVVIAATPFARPDAEVWTVEHDGFGEFAAGKPYLEAVLRANGEAIARVTAMPEKIYFARGMARLNARIASMVVHELDAERRRPRRLIRQRLAAGPSGGADAAASAGGPPALRIALRSAINYVKQQWRDRFTRVQWSIAFTFHDPLDLRGYTLCLPPRDRLWADPFVLTHGDRAFIFLEEYVYTEKRGVISVLEAHRDGTWTQPRRVLERPYHLSYPCVFRWNGDYWMVPETQENHTIELYRCVDFPMRWELDTVLFRDLDAVDATVFEHEGRWWMYYATNSGDDAGFDRLWAFHADTPRGPWVPHRLNPLECDVFGGRPAGRPFAHGGKLVRSTQIGAPWYGHAMQLRELVALTPSEWEERAIATIGPEWFPRGTGTHTLNADGDCAVADAVRRRLRRPSEPAP